MNNSEFKKKLVKWLENEGLIVLGEWDIEETIDSVKIMAKIKIDGEENKGCSITENKEETIETAVLALNDQLINKLNEDEPE